MAHPKVSYHRAKAISLALFLISVAVLLLMNNFWPGFLLAVGVPLAIRHYLLGRIYDMFLTLAIFGGAYIASGYDINWDILLPVILVVAAIYLLAKEFFDPDSTDEVEDEECQSWEIEEDTHKK